MTESRPGSGGRRGRQARLTVRSQAQQKRARVVWPGLEGGIYKPLSQRDVERIHEGALRILAGVGMGGATPEIIELARAKGLEVTDDQRIRFPAAYIDDVVAGAGRNFILYGRDRAHDLDISGSKVHYGTAGAAVSVPDFETGKYRESRLLDIYDFGRLVDRLPNIHWFGRTVVPTELEGGETMDVNIVYAAAAATQKHVAAGFTCAEGIYAAVQLFDMILGGEGRFAEQPCCSVYCTGVVPPLRYGELSLDVAVAAARVGMPVDFIIAAQAGATAPASLAGALVQTTAEGLGGVALVNLVKPGHPTIFSNWPFASDLRTGSFSGGGPEEALLNAASAQIANFYDLPSGVACSMTDSKLPDAQSGYEKAMTSLLTGLSGANLIHEAAGMQASLLGCSHEALVIDSEMLGNALRAVRGIEVTDETLSVEVIEEVVKGAGHFLGHEQTLTLMETEYIYPDLGDRERPVTWEERGSLDIRARAHERVREILSSHYPEYIDPAVDAKIRDAFDIRLAPEALKPGGGRW
ncbi:MAG: trimethylamine methyltransferase family protein [Myxococcales bacterium]|nr:trimethylamine methyltransferase family protein [Myxococcales bacterium]MDH5306120.1 trimethylamine methyltransferase family protein [Myxococcales bacterium]MDH5566881.1 trimethylamine methyltransferase family protein [Myxococcales bacterium]